MCVCGGVGGGDKSILNLFYESMETGNLSGQAGIRVPEPF